MADPVSVIGLGVSLFPLLKLAWKKLLLFSRARRQRIRNSLRRVKVTYEGVQLRVNALDKDLRLRFTHELTEVSKAMESLDNMMKRSSRRTNKRTRFIRLLRRAAFYLIGEEAIACAVRQLDDINREFGNYDLLFVARSTHCLVHLLMRRRDVEGKTNIYLVRVFRELRSLKRHVKESAKQSKMVDEITDGELGFEYIAARDAADYSGASTGHLNDQIAATHRAGHRSRRHHNTAQRPTRHHGGRASEKEKAAIRPHACGIRIRHCEQAQDETTRIRTHGKSESSNTNGARQSQAGSTSSDHHCQAKVGTSHLDDGVETYDEKSIDNDEDELSGTTVSSVHETDSHRHIQITADTVTGQEPIITNSEVDTNFPLAADTSEVQLGPANSPHADENVDPVFGPPNCPHQDVSCHSWSWSLVFYASCGLRLKCRACGRQWTKTASSKMATWNDGVIEINWEHIVQLKWWPGGAWGWS